MHLLFVSIFLIHWHAVWAEEPVVLLKETVVNPRPSDLNDAQQSAESSKEKPVTPAPKKLHSDGIDTYTSGLTPQFRTLLLAPDSTESQILRKPTKDPKKENAQHEAEEKAEPAYVVYRNEFEGVPQAHLDQLLRYYGKIAGKLLPQGYAKFRKIATESEKTGTDKQDEPAEVKEAATLTETSNSEPKTSPSTEHVVNTAVNAAIANAAALAALQATSTIPGYGALNGAMNYLNAANYGPPRPQNAYIAAALRNQLSSYLPAQTGYGVPNCCNNICPPCNTQSSNYENSCGGSNIQNSNNMALGGVSNGCANEYNTADVDNDEYGPDSYFQGGYGANVASHENGATNSASNRHSQLLSSYSSHAGSSPNLYGSSKQPSSYYQVSSPINNPFLVDAHPYSPVGSLFATSHMHHFGSYPSINNNPFQQYYGTLNAYPNSQRFGYGTSMSDNELGNQYGYSSSPFGPMFDYAAGANNEPETTTFAAVQSQSTKAPKATKLSSKKNETKTTKSSSEQIEQKATPLDGMFHIVRPNFASLKKVALMKKHRLFSASKSTRKPESQPNSTTPSTVLSTTTVNNTLLTTTNKNVIVARKMSKILVAKKSSTPAPKTTVSKQKDKLESSTVRASTKSATVTVINSTDHSNATKKIRS